MEKPEAFINRLPSEVLSDIFETTPLPNERYPWRKIMLVCRRWRAIGQRFLYRHIALDTADSATEILDFLRGNPHVASYVRDLNLVSDSSEDFEQQWTLDLLKSFSLNGELSIKAELGQGARPLLEYVQTLPLTGVHLHGAPSLNMVFEFFSVPTLRELSLTLWGWRKDGDFCLRHTRLPHRLSDTSNTYMGPQAWVYAKDICNVVDDSPLNRKDLDTLFPPDRKGTATLTALNLHIPGTDMAVTKRLLEWPARLTELKITGLRQSRYALYYTWKNLELLFSIHMKSLRKLHIGSIIYKNEGIPDFSNYPCLEDLTVFSDEIFEDKPRVALQKLAAPWLRHLTIEFDPDIPRGPPRPDYSVKDSERGWMRTFFKCMRQTPELAILRDVTALFKIDPKVPTHGTHCPREGWHRALPGIERYARESQVKFEYFLVRELG